MGKQRTRFEAWFARWRGVRTPQEEAAVLEVADAYDGINKTNLLTPAQLAVIVRAASSPRALLWMNAIELLSDLTTRWEAATGAAAEMFASRHSHVRFAALCCVNRDMAIGVANRLLRGGLEDKSSRVRWKAAEKICDLDRKEFLPQLEGALLREKHPKARASIEFDLRLLRDGYIIRPGSPSGFNVTVRVKDGISSSFVTDEIMQAKGVDAVAAELRRL